MEATATVGESGAPQSHEIGSACPIADALRPIRRQRALADGGAPATMRVDAVEALATLLDLTGSMALAVQLESPTASDVGPPSGAPSARDLSRLIGERCEQLAAAVHRRLAELPTSRSAIWGAERLADEVTRRGLLGSKRGRGAAVLAHEATDSYVLAIRGLLDRIRGDLRGLRIEIGPRLALRGPSVARLEAFDALVGRARAAATHRLIGRIPRALADDFAWRFEQALEALDAASAGPAIAAWYRRDGFVPRFHADVCRVVDGVFEHDRIALLELVEAARALESDDRAGRTSDRSPGAVAPGGHTTHAQAGGARP